MAASAGLLTVLLAVLVQPVEGQLGGQQQFGVGAGGQMGGMDCSAVAYCKFESQVKPRLAAVDEELFVKKQNIEGALQELLAMAEEFFKAPGDVLDCTGAAAAVYTPQFVFTAIRIPANL